jgi:hypothetical protein
MAMMTLTELLKAFPNIKKRGSELNMNKGL